MNSLPPERGHLFVIAAPSGAGKTTLVHQLMGNHNNLRFSISYTTRPQRHTEVPEQDYFFVQAEAFQAMVDAGDFLEHANVFDFRYGTSKTQVEGLLNEGYNVILEIDWQGAQQVRNHMSDARGIFILPPTVAELKKRLAGRGTDSEEVIARRFRDALDDLSHWEEFDFAVINDDLGRASAELSAIVQGSGDANLVTTPEMQARIAAIISSG